MPRLSFTLRDVFWLTLVVGMGCAWWGEWRHAGNQQIKLYRLEKAIEFTGRTVLWSDGIPTLRMKEPEY